ncbi:YggS family pyridoxal phosphate-dependent enzyme [Novipirellula artificiosorum]|uniref:Pyridoxal phosphate homeostasis protein n=1 Tax=Novipirellula artificiosorum TaxID=2528016 RepID=A0A5C6D5M2_9BACT|nr:YggS family pyridoxal phosphate-dependent enzyme [Novipirellula artificiosorum]TWU31021.1 Pyridoxal phosphate homeostasis protein [Novipirellula artificiosorum]
MIDGATRTQLSKNWNAVTDEVQQATVAAGRPAGSTKIVGVTKYVGAETTLALAEAGCYDLGESRPQLLWQKVDEVAFPPQVQWHLIGHVQRNKLRRSLSLDPIIHSVDSGRLLIAIAEEAAAQQRTATVLVEVNISGEAAKTGLAPEQVETLLTQLPRNGVVVVGLMAMAGWGIEASEARSQFAETRRLRDDLQSRLGVCLPELSMGMSGDFIEAIAAGATMVRIGSRLFEGLPT